MGTDHIQDTSQAADAPEKKEVIQNTYLEQLLGPDKAAVLLKKYFLDLAQKTALLTEYFQGKNMEEIRKIAHQLKGSGKSYGFKYITEIGTELSSCAKKKDFSTLRNLIQDLDRYTETQQKRLEKI